MANISFSQGIFETGSAKNDGEMGDRPRGNSRRNDIGRGEILSPRSVCASILYHHCLCSISCAAAPAIASIAMARTRAQRLSHVLILASISISCCPGVRTRRPTHAPRRKAGDARAAEALEKACLLLPLRLSRRQTWYTHKAEAHRPRPAAADRQSGRDLSKTRAQERMLHRRQQSRHFVS